jgi:hypothetical protein
MGGAVSLLGAGGPELPLPQARRATTMEAVEVAFEAEVLCATQTLHADGSESAPSAASSAYLLFGKLRAFTHGAPHLLDPPFLLLAPLQRCAGVGIMPVCERVAIFSSRTLRTVVYYRGELALELMPQPGRGGERTRYVVRVDDAALSKKTWKAVTRQITLVFRNFWAALATQGVPHEARRSGWLTGSCSCWCSTVTVLGASLWAYSCMKIGPNSRMPSISRVGDIGDAP